MPAGLAVRAALPELRAALAEEGAAVLVAPPGTGKTTAVPPALADEPWAREQRSVRRTDGGGGRILVVVPRRMAARAAAARMAHQHGQSVGGRFGYSVRHDRKVSGRTVVEVVTTGLLLRRLQADPSLEGTAAVLLDEFHERSADLDLCLALLLDVRAALREDLRLLAMSATIDPGPIARLLGSEGAPAPVLTVEAPMFGVRTVYRPGSVHDRLSDRVADVVVEALAAGNDDTAHGDVLVFLPGRGEIAATARALEHRNLGGESGGGGRGPVAAGPVVLALHGSTPPSEQDRILSPRAGGPRRVILATSIAETSITVPGVRVVVDAGRRRTQESDPRTGLPGLVTRAVSMAGADQRRGRSGREAPGVCYRLWSAAEEHSRPATDSPELAVADLAPLLLQVLAWGAASPDELRWLDPPSRAGLDRARALLDDLGALQPGGRLSALGQRLAHLGFHPRLGAIALAGDGDDPGLSAEVAAVIEVGGPGPNDVAERVRALRTGNARVEVDRAARDWRRRLGVDRGGVRSDPDEADLDRRVGRMVLAGFADRLAHRRTGRTDDRGRPITVFQLRHGGEVEATDRSGHLAGHEWVVVVDLDARAGSGRPGRLHLGSGLQPDAVAELLANHVREHRSASFDPSTGRVVGTVRRMLDDITVESRTWRRPDRGAVVAAVADAIARHGPAVLARWNEADTLRARVRFLAAHEQSGAGESERSGQTRPGASSTGTTWPDMGEAHLGATAADWLTPTGSDPALLDVRAALEARLDWQQRRALDVDAPVSWTAPDGRAFRLRYGELPGEPDKVVLSAQLQDLLGLDLHPTVGTRRVPVTVEILSPARRPVQRTEDLPGFWRGSYAQVRAELRARYRKHPWPERPWEAAPPDRRLRGS